MVKHYSLAGETVKKIDVLPRRGAGGKGALHSRRISLNDRRRLGKRLNRVFRLQEHGIGFQGNSPRQAQIGGGDITTQTLASVVIEKDGQGENGYNEKEVKGQQL